MDVVKFLLALVAALGVPIVLATIVNVRRRSRRERRDEPVLDAILRFEWREGWREITYRDELARNIHVELQTMQRREEPLRTGTRVDLTVRLGQVEFYLTIKRNIDNQARLTLQGEAEDIVAECRARRGNGAATIVVIIGRPADVDEADIKAESTFIDDLGADSLDTVELVMALEEEFGIEVPDEQAEKLQSVGDVIKYIEDQQQK